MGAAADPDQAAARRPKSAGAALNLGASSQKGA
jgi:hypothetical protein